jgi:glycosyltransferase involved in cell wall biosynthesis
VETGDHREPGRLRVLYFIGGNHIGGMETHLLHLIGGLHRERYEPAIVCFDLGAEYRDRLRSIGIEPFDLGIPRLTSPAQVLRLTRFLRILRRVNPHLLHTYGFTCDVVGPLLARACPGARVITTRRGEDTSRRHQAARSTSNRLTDVVVCVSDATLAFTRRTESLHRATPTVIPNGVVIPPIPSRRPGVHGLRFGTLGTVKSIKGTDLLIEAFLGLDPSRRCELFIGGRLDRDSPWASGLVDKVQASPWAGRVHFLGFQRDPGSFYAGIDVFVLPSRSEGMSNSLLEAMAQGLPCVATDVGSNGAVLHEGRDGAQGGIVTEVSAGAIRAALETMLESDVRRTAWARDARHLAETRYSIAAMVRAHEGLYETLGHPSSWAANALSARSSASRSAKSRRMLSGGK